MFVEMNGYRTYLETDVDNRKNEARFFVNLLRLIHNKKMDAGSILFEAAFDSGLLYDLISLDSDDPQYIITVIFAKNLKDVSVEFTTRTLQNISDRAKINLIVSSSSFYDLTPKKENAIGKTFNDKVVKIAKEGKYKVRNDVELNLEFR